MQLHGWPEGSLKSCSSREYGVTNMFSANHQQVKNIESTYQPTRSTLIIATSDLLKINVIEKQGYY